LSSLLLEPLPFLVESIAALSSEIPFTRRCLKLLIFYTERCCVSHCRKTGTSFIVKQEQYINIMQNMNLFHSKIGTIYQYNAKQELVT
jgi:hypothetical protein